MKMNYTCFWASTETALIDILRSLETLQYYFRRLKLVKNKDQSFEKAIKSAYHYFKQSFRYAEYVSSCKSMDSMLMASAYEKHKESLESHEESLIEYLNAQQFAEKEDPNCVIEKSIDYSMGIIESAAIIPIKKRMLNQGGTWGSLRNQKAKVIEAMAEMARCLNIDAYFQRSKEWQIKGSSDARVALARILNEYFKIKPS